MGRARAGRSLGVGRSGEATKATPRAQERGVGRPKLLMEARGIGDITGQGGLEGQGC